jgi:hypothetical protein
MGYHPPLKRTGIPLNIVRRIGASPRERGSLSGDSCPDIFELSDGRFAVIGTEATAALDQELPPDAARADYERIVIISRDTLLRAKADIPDE